jgi:hypothetical protein
VGVPSSLKILFIWSSSPLPWNSGSPEDSTRQNQQDTDREDTGNGLQKQQHQDKLTADTADTMP